MKSIFVSMLAIATLASCNKESVPTQETEMGSFEVVLPGAPETYAVEDPQTAGAITPKYDDVTVFLVDAGDNATMYAWTDSEIKARSKRFEQIVKPTKVIVVANKGNVTLSSGTTSAIEDMMESLAIANQNKVLATIAVEDAKGNVAGDYISAQQVTLYGECASAAFTSMTPDDGHTLFKASVELKSLVSRFEVGTLKAGTGLESISVEAVYVNYFYKTIKMDDAQSNNESSWPTAFTPDWATDAGNAGVTSLVDTKCYAYQVFTGDLVPHIIYKVSGVVTAGYRLSDGTGDVTSNTAFADKYITIKGFKVGTDIMVGGTAGVGEYQMKAHEIYKLGLEAGGIVITPEKITDKPEKEKIDLIVEVTVADWTVKNVTPEI